jgi:hypothetical protein
MTTTPSAQGTRALPSPGFMLGCLAYLVQLRRTTAHLRTSAPDTAISLNGFWPHAMGLRLCAQKREDLKRRSGPDNRWAWEENPPHWNGMGATRAVVDLPDGAGDDMTPFDQQAVGASQSAVSTGSKTKAAELHGTACPVYPSIGTSAWQHRKRYPY